MSKCTLTYQSITPKSNFHITILTCIAILSVSVQQVIARPINKSLLQQGIMVLKESGYPYDIESRNKAIKLFNAAIKQNPRLADAYLERGKIMLMQSKYQEAIADFDRAILENPQLADVYHERGLALSQIGNKSEVLANYNRAIKIFPNNYLFYARRGDINDELKNYERAISDYDRAISIERNNSFIYQSRADTKLKLKSINTVALFSYKISALEDHKQALKIAKKENDLKATIYSEEQIENIQKDFPNATLLSVIVLIIAIYVFNMVIRNR